MLPEHKKTLKSLVLTLRHLFEGHYDESGAWHPGDLERRLNALGVFADREVPLHDMGQLPDADRRARDVADAYIALRDSAGVSRETAVREYVRESAHTWANRLLALRMMEARGLIDEVVLARADYGNRSLEHHRALQADPSLRTQEDEGLASVLEGVFTRMSDRLPNLFEPASPATALRPSTTALKKAIALLSGTEAPRGQQPSTGDVFTAADALGWAYQYWNTEEKDRVFEAVRTKKAKISGDDIIPATQLYTEPYMVKFLVQNSLGATWMCMHPDSKLAEGWEYYVRVADREPMDLKVASELTFLDPACGSGHFLLEAFDMLFDFYEEEGERDASAIATSILEHNLYGIDIDERAVQIAEAALWMRAAERVPGFTGLPANLLATNIRLPEEKAGVDAYLAKHPEDAPLRPALEAVLSSLQHADELGSLLKLEEPIEGELKSLERAFERSSAKGTQVALFGETPVQGQLPVGVSSYSEWKRKVVDRLAEHFHDEAVSADAGAAWFGRSAGKGLKLFELLSRRYDVVAANPPYMGSNNLSGNPKEYLDLEYPAGKSDLYAAFLLRAETLADCMAFVTMNTFMFATAFQALRSRLIEVARPSIMCELGPGAFSEIGGAVVNVVLTIVSASSRTPSRVLHKNLTNLPIQQKNEALTSGRSWDAVEWSGIEAIPGSPFVLGVVPEFYRWFALDDGLGSLFECIVTCKTSDNSRFLRQWWEAPSTSRWVPYEKDSIGTPFTSQPQYLIDWSAAAQLYYRSHFSAQLPNIRHMFTSGVVTSGIGGESATARLLPASALADMAVNEMLSLELGEDWHKALCAILNSRVAKYVLARLNPTVNFFPFDLKRLPFSSLLRDAGSRERLVESWEAGNNIASRNLAEGPHQAGFESRCRSSSSSQSLGEVLDSIDSVVASGMGIPVASLAEMQAAVGAWDPAIREHDAASALADDVAVLVLRALGHRWPKEIEAGLPAASYADLDGVIPISEGTDERTLIERLRDVIEDETGTAAPIFEAHFADAMGISLESWLATKFFAHHVKQFKKRPIAWHLVSSRPTARRQPAFSALVYYHALDADLIPKIRSHYLNPLRSRAETELRGIEATPEAARSAEQVSRRAELDERIAELKDLGERLEAVEREGFESSELAKLIATEKIDTFCSGDGIKPKPVDTDAFIAQERAYLPDLNDGVRVNISPWQKAGALAADVLVTKDLDKAIADRARWRSDERRWCREGKLPRPGWWPEG